MKNDRSIKTYIACPLCTEVHEYTIIISPSKDITIKNVLCCKGCLEIFIAKAHLHITTEIEIVGDNS